MSYPSNTQIAEIFSKLSGDRDGFIGAFAPDITITVLGQEHEFANTYNGAEELRTKLIKPILDLLDLEGSPVQGDVVRVVGGGTPWAAVEVKNTSTSKLGKPYIHEHAYFVNFNEEGKIAQLRAYFDTNHMNGHVADAK